MIIKLIKLIKEYHWKVYGKNHLKKQLRRSAKIIFDKWYDRGMKKPSYLYGKLWEHLNALEEIEKW